MKTKKEKSATNLIEIINDFMKTKKEKSATNLIEIIIGLAIISALLPSMIEYLSMPWYKRIYLDFKRWVLE